MTDEDFDLLVSHNCAGVCDCAECRRIRAIPIVRKTYNLPATTPVKSCNRHVDCEVAEQVFKEKNGRLPNLSFHCHDDECEDCFGC